MCLCQGAVHTFTVCFVSKLPGDLLNNQKFLQFACTPVVTNMKDLNYSLKVYGVLLSHSGLVRILTKQFNYENKINEE